MKLLVRYVAISIFFITILSSCEKDKTSDQIHTFYKLKVNGSSKNVEACGTTDHVASYLKDTAVFVAFGCDGRRAGFYLRGSITDGTYSLDNYNSAWFDEGTASYTTDSLNTGILTIKTGNFQAIAGIIPYVKGTFSFNAIDKITGQKIEVSGGSYLLKKYQY